MNRGNICPKFEDVKSKEDEMKEKKPPRKTKARKRNVEIGSEQKFTTYSTSTKMTGLGKDKITGVDNPKVFL